MIENEIIIGTMIKNFCKGCLPQYQGRYYNLDIKNIKDFKLDDETSQYGLDVECVFELIKIDNVEEKIEFNKAVHIKYEFLNCELANLSLKIGRVKVEEKIFELGIYQYTRDFA